MSAGVDMCEYARGAATRIRGSAAAAVFERAGCVAGATVFIFSGSSQYSGTVRECDDGSLCVSSGEWRFIIFANSGGSLEAVGVVPGTTRTRAGCVAIVRAENEDEDEDDEDDEELAAAAAAVLSLASDGSSVDDAVPSGAAQSTYTDDENGKSEDDVPAATAAPEIVSCLAIGSLAWERITKLRASTIALEMVDEWDQKAQQMCAVSRMSSPQHLERLKYEAAVCSLVAVKHADAMVRLDAPAMRAYFTSEYITDVRTRALAYTKSANFASTYVHAHAFMRVAAVVEATGVDELTDFLLEMAVA